MRSESGNKTGRRTTRWFKVINLPCMAKYCQRRLEEGRILNEIKDMCLAPKQGTLLFRGAIGVGKTTQLSHIFADEANKIFFLRECKIDTIIWLNCQQFSSDNLAAFVKQLLQLGRLICPDDTFAVFYNIGQMMQYLAVNKRHHVLIALDDVKDLKLLEVLRRDCPEVSSCAILHETLSVREKTPPGLIRKTVMIEPLPDEHMYDLLSGTYDLKNKLKDEYIKELTRFCFGHHLFASLLAYRLNDCFDCRSTMNDHIQVIQSAINPTPLLLSRHFYEQNLGKMDPILHKNYHAFLLYQPGEPVSLDDLVILWGYCGDYDAKERALQFCSYFEKKSLIRRVHLFGDPKCCPQSESGYYFILHPFFHEIAVELSKQHYHFMKQEMASSKELFLAKLRMEVAKGSACTDGANVKTAVDIACQCVTHQRRHLLEKIIDSLDANDLAYLLRQKSELSNQKTFLHHLYESQWHDNVVYCDKANIARGINHSYRLIVRILNKLKQGGVHIKPLFIERDEINGTSLLKTIFKDIEQKSVHKLERLPIIRTVARYQHDCDEQLWYDRLLAKKDPIITAVLRNDLQVLRDLLSKKAASGYFKGDYLAFTAARLDKLDALKIICERFGNSAVLAMVDEEDGNTVFSLAARNGHIDVLNYLVLVKSDFIAWRNAKSGRTMLMSAASNGHLKTVRFLSEWDGENIGTEMEPHFGSYTALALAAANGHVDTVRYLVEKCSHAVQFGDGSKNALLLAAENGHSEVVALLADRFPTLANSTALNAALLNGQVEVAKVLLAKQPYLINGPTELGYWSPLMSAAADCDLDGVIYIYELNKGAIKIRDASGWTALMAAVNRAKLDVVVFLYEQYPDAIKIQDESGYTPLALASQTGCYELVQFLYDKYNEAVEMVDVNGEPPFMRAVFSDSGNLAIVRFLFEKYSNAPAMRNNYTVTPLMNAAFKHNLEICHFLCDVFPAGINWRDDNGKTALDYAKSAASLEENRRKETIAFLSSKIKKDDKTVTIENGQQLYRAERTEAML